MQTCTTNRLSIDPKIVDFQDLLQKVAFVKIYGLLEEILHFRDEGFFKFINKSVKNPSTNLQKSMLNK